ncbi:MAG: ATP synthase F1 subunit delta [Spirochaetota bacterium]|nr:ATP synthase F1 subunit delta [Spirochaetota bacterium]
MAENEVSRAYAGALLEIGLEKDTLDQIEEELDFIKSIVLEDEELSLFFNSPGIPKYIKKDFVDKAFSENLSDNIISFLKVIIDNNRQSLISEINDALIEMIDKEHNRQRVEVVSSEKLEKIILEKIENTLANKLGKKIILEEVVDKDIIGGIIIKVGDLIFNGSIKKNLKEMKDILLLSKIESGVVYED